MTVEPNYSVGTATLTLSVTVVLDGESPAPNLVGNALEGDLFVCAGRAASIAAIVDGVTLTLASAWDGPTGTGKPYVIHHVAPGWHSVVALNEQVQALLARIAAGMLTLPPNYSRNISDRDQFDAVTTSFAFGHIVEDGEAVDIYLRRLPTAGEWDGPIRLVGTDGIDGEPGPQGPPGVLMDQYSIDIRHRDGDLLATPFLGEYAVDRKIGNAGLMTRFYGEVVDGSGTVTAAFAIDGETATPEYEIEAGEPVDLTGLSIELPQGSDISFHLTSITGDVRWVWLKVEGQPL